jgi:NTE family protein
MGGVNARPRIDTLDNRYFPRAGYDAGVQVYAARGVLGADDTYTKLSAASSYHVSALGLLDGAYVGGSLETGCLAALVIAGQHPTTRVGASLYFAFDTPLGPVYLAYGHGEGSNQAVYLFLGQPP